MLPDPPDPPDAEPTTIDNTADAKLQFGLDEQPGGQIGDYKLLERLGAGGSGTVWKAEQSKPVSRQVALKIIELGMDSKEVIARFEAERRALAGIEHPNIASVYDAGATETGRPYFVMELVRGIPVTKFCDEQRLDIRARLEIFIDICAALDHAHENGVIHGDLKPSNVLVTSAGDSPVPKVIDFGIAQAVGPSLTDRTPTTLSDQVIGNPLYRSPEQLASGAVDIDTRSDIYSLGALLYECLTGLTPFDTALIANADSEEIRRTVREQQPTKPSTRIAGCSTGEKTRLGHARHTDIHKLRKQLKGNLDGIVLKAMEKDRSRRYETASALILDIRRFLAGEDVSAAPPSATDRLQKLVRRHRTAVAIAAAIALTLTAVSLWPTGQAREAQNLATPQVDEAQQVQTEPLARRAYEAHLNKFGEAHPQTVALRKNLASILVGLARYEEAGSLFRRNVELTGRTPENYLEYAAAISTLAHYLENRGDPREAIELHRQALEIVSAHLPEEHAETLSRLDVLTGAMLLLAEQGDPIHLVEAASLADRIYKLKATRWASDPSLPEPTQLQLATARRLQGKTTQAETLLDGVLAIPSDQPQNHLVALNEMVLTKIALKNYQAASEYAAQLDLLHPAVRTSHAAHRQGMLEALNNRANLQPGLFEQQHAEIPEESEDHDALARTAAIIAFAPTAPAETLAAATALAGRAFDIDPTAFNAMVLASAKIRTGQPDSAIALLAPHIGDASWLTSCPALALSAIANHEIGNHEESARLWSDCQQRQRSAPRLDRWNDATLDAVLLVDLTMATARGDLSP